MKILFAAPYIYDKNHEEFKKNCSGFGFMVKDILDGISVNEEVLLVTLQNTKGYFDKYTVLQHTFVDIIKNLRFRDIFEGLYYFFKFKQSLSMRFRYLYYPLNKGVFINNLKQTNPDLVHIHGLTYQTKPFIDCCEYLNIPYMLTLHGLNGKLNTLHKHECEFEVDMLKKLRKNNINVSVVSSGIKKRIKTDYGIDTNNISVILNGIKSQKTNSYLCNKQDSTFYNIICVGNISIRKNQLQLIRAYKLLPDEIQRKIKICFCGLNINHIPIQNEIQKSKYPENLIYMGFVSRDEMTNLWKNSDLNVVMSIDEGFGLSMIEGFSFGVPTLTFNDIDAVGDIYNEHSMKLIEKRDDHEIAKKILECINFDWNKNKIIEWSENFSLYYISEQYTKMYRRIIEGY